MSSANEPSESLRALKVSEEVRRLWEHVGREVRSLEKSLAMMDPESEEAKDMRNQIQIRKSELEILDMQCKELRTIWEGGKMRASREQFPN